MDSRQRGKLLKPLLKSGILDMAPGAGKRAGEGRAAARAFLSSELAHKLNDDTGWARNRRRRNEMGRALRPAGSPMAETTVFALWK